MRKIEINFKASCLQERLSGSKKQEVVDQKSIPCFCLAAVFFIRNRKLYGPLILQWSFHSINLFYLYCMLSVNKAKDIQMQQPLMAPFFKNVTIDTPIEQISSLLDNEDRKSLSHALWNETGYKPKTHFTLSYGVNSLFLKFYVEEKVVTAAYGCTNEPVYKDSCVEFFIGFDDKGYYNFEFNCIGTCLAEFGSGKDDRTFLPEEYLEKVKSQSVITRNSKNNTVNWTITVVIPLCVFQFHSLSYLSGLESKVNFFKCGDSLPEPHFLAWTNIEVGEPNFHLPQFFGTMMFK